MSTLLVSTLLDMKCIQNAASVLIKKKKENKCAHKKRVHVFLDCIDLCARQRFPSCAHRCTLCTPLHTTYALCTLCTLQKGFQV